MLEVPGYDVGQMLGFGGRGEVWRGRSRVTGEYVALKRLRPGSDPAAVADLHREAAVLAGVSSPHVLRVRDVVGEVLVLDLCEGGSLAALLRARGRLEPGEVVTVAAPLAQALAAVHAGGLVHGDVTPSNVLLTADGMPVLSDFGSARVAGAPGDVEGTAEYVDPAVAAGGAPGPASDVWALGALCHHLLAGSPPHEGGTVEEVLDAGLAGGRAPLGLLAPRVPRALVAVVEAALVREPAARPSAVALAAALQRACPARPVLLQATGPAVPEPDPADVAPWDRPSWAAALPLRVRREEHLREARSSSPDPLPGSPDALSVPPGVPPLAHEAGRESGADERPTHRVPRPHRAPAPAARRTLVSRLPLAALGGVIVVLLLLVGGLVWAFAGAAAEPLSVAGPAVLAPGQDAAPLGPATPTGAADPVAAPVDGEVATPDGMSDPGTRPGTPVTPDLGTPGVEPRGDPGPVPAVEPALDWAGVLEGLDAERARAFASGDTRSLDRVHVAGSPGLVADQQLLASLGAEGLRAEEVRHEVREVREVARQGDVVELRVVDVLRPHALVTADGSVVEQRPGRPATALVVVLRSTPVGWRIEQVTPA